MRKFLCTMRYWIKVVVPAAFLAGSSLIMTSCGAKSNDPAARGASQGGPLSVNAVVVQPQPLENVVRSSGTVLASESVELAAEASGRVEKIFFREGAHVGANALLVKINDDDLQAQLRKTEFQIRLASEQEERQKHLFDMNGISREQYDVALNQVNMLQADRDNLLASIRRREIRAPFDGVVGLRYVSEGSYVTPSTRIASMQKINPLKVDFSIPEKYAGQVSVGDPAQFKSEQAGIELSGKVYAIEPKIDPALGTLQLRALCENRGEKVFPGAYVQIEMQLRQIGGALLVPTQAIVPVLKGQTVFVRRNGTVASVPVSTGIRTAASVQITGGLAAGDTVLTTGIMQLRPGMPVSVTVQ